MADVMVTRQQIGIKLKDSCNEEAIALVGCVRKKRTAHVARRHSV